MKFITSLLFLLSLSVVYGQDDSTTEEPESPEETEFEVVSWDSEDADATGSYSGIVVQVYKDDGSPTITMSSRKNGNKDTYCLNFVKMFESADYDTLVTTNADYTAVEGSTLDFSAGGDVDFTITESATDEQFTLVGSVGDATLTLDFVFTQDDAGDYGLKYTVNLENYVFVQEDAYLVMAVKVVDCTADYAYSGDSGDSEDSVDEDDEDDEEDDDATTRRRMGDDDDVTTDGDETDDEEEEEDDEDDDAESDSLDESAGISSDDSDEYDVGVAQFISDSPAYDRCVDDSGNVDEAEVETALVYQEGDEVLHIIYGYFECNLFQDPWFGMDDSKMDGANSFKFILSAIVAIFACLLV